MFGEGKVALCVIIDSVYNYGEVHASPQSNGKIMKRRRKNRKEKMGKEREKKNLPDSPHIIII